MDLATVGTIIGIASGLISMGTWTFGVVERLQKRPASSPLVAAPTIPDVRQGQARGGPLPMPPVIEQPALPASSSSSGYAPPGQIPMAPTVPGYGSAMPAPVPSVQAKRWRIRHPWIALGSGVSFILYVIYLSVVSSSSSDSSSSDPTAVVLLLLYTGIFLATWIAAIVVTSRLRRWGWLIALILLSVYAGLVFGIFGPTTRRQPKVPAAQPALRL